MVSWVVSPSSGAAPYIFTAVFKNKNLIDGVNYSLEVAAALEVGVCFDDPSGGIISGGATASVLATNSFSYDTSVPAGSCFTGIARIRVVSSGELLDAMQANVSNI